MPSTRVTVGSKVGLHARPARLLVDAVKKLGTPVRIGRTEEETVDAASILAVMALGVGPGEEIVVVADEQPAVDQIAELLAKDLDSAA